MPSRAKRKRSNRSRVRPGGLSPAMKRVLKCLLAGESPYECAHSMYEAGGLQGPLGALIRRRLITPELELTEKGKEAVKKLQGGEA